MKRRNCGPAPVEDVETGSPAAQAGIRRGDRIWRINGEPLRDAIDFYMALSESDSALLEVGRGGETLLVRMDLGTGPVGIVLGEPVFGRLATCVNNCMFCFVDQLPEGLREPLYVKDADYRVSFLGGNFITLASLDRGDIRRIAGDRLSPLYVSLHSTEIPVRKRLFGNPDAARPLNVLKRLLKAGIEIHAQIVLVRGLNDGEHLDRTLGDLRDRFGAVRSVGVVPVGMSSGGRRTLDDKYGFDRVASLEVLEQVEAWRGRLGEAGPFAADEFFFLAGEELPPGSYYGDYEQLENGIGISRRFIEEFEAARQGTPAGVESLAGLGIVTGPLGSWALAPLGIERTGARFIVCENDLFGKKVNVCGLLPGASVARALSESGNVRLALVPSVAVDRESRFIDGISIGDVEEKSGVRVEAVPSTGEGLARALERISNGGFAG